MYVRGWCCHREIKLVAISRRNSQNFASVVVVGEFSQTRDDIGHGLSSLLKETHFAVVDSDSCMKY